MAPLSRFGPPVALMGLIFFLSAQPDLTSGLGTLDVVLRKLAHMVEFGLLWLLWLRALRWDPPAPVAAAAITVLYAASDELHQSFVDGRVGSPLDWGIDVVGVLVAWLLVRRRANRRRTGRSEPAALGGDENGLRPVDRADLAVDVVQVGPDRAGRER